jgi:uncharacterized Zn finger protein
MAAQRSSPRRNFGNTWWGRAWVEALEERAVADPNRLPRGRTYARQGTVSGLQIGLGEIKARVRGRSPRPYHVTIRMRGFSPGQWEILLTTIAGQIGHTAALLDGELPTELAEQARAAGADLLPGAGDLTPRCSCPDSANPCKHIAAVYYLVADEVDADPFVLFLARGRRWKDLSTELRAKRSRASAAPVPALASRDVGLTPQDAFARRVASVPAVPGVPGSAGRPSVLPVDPPANTGLRAEVLTELAADAAVRAWGLLAGGTDDEELSFEEDVVRRAASLPEREVAELAMAAGMPVRELAGSAVAWREAGRGGLAAFRGSWQPKPGQLAEAKAELAEAGLPGRTTAWRNRLTHGEIQLRLGTEGRWYRLVKGKAVSGKRDTEWLLDGPPVERPLDVIYPMSDLR